MSLVDANVLIYAVNEDAPHHEPSRRWLDDACSGPSPLGLAWPALLAFLRLTTRPGLFPRPLAVSDALDQIEAWVDAPATTVLVPTPRHVDVLRGLVEATGTGGNLTSDAHLAALALEHRYQVVTWDADFGRFPGIRSVTPRQLLDR